jgi:Tfp pilus assembly protein PilN
MPFINLIQEQRLEAKRSENKARLFFMSFIGSAVLSVGAIGFLMFQNEMLCSEESALNAKAQKLQPLVKRIEQNDNDYSEVQPRLTTLQNAQLITGHWSRILDHLTRQTPNETWLTAIRCVSPDPTKPVSITFAGLSTRQELVGDFIMRMQGCPDLTNVNLSFTREKLIADGRDIEFEVTSDIDGTADVAKKDEMKKEPSDEKTPQS